jgi:hypothetical protein
MPVYSPNFIARGIQVITFIAHLSCMPNRSTLLNKHIHLPDVPVLSVGAGRGVCTCLSFTVETPGSTDFEVVGVLLSASVWGLLEQDAIE